MSEGHEPHIPRDEQPDRPVDPLTQLRALPHRYREVLSGGRAGQPADGSGELPPEAVEKAAEARDLLENTARRVERLVEDTKPVTNMVESHPPRRGPYALDADVVLDVLDTNAERLARLAEEAPEAAGERAGVRDGIKSIAGEIVAEAVTESERRLRQAERSIDESG
jgi:ABC-type transporter Mla subunit MlaD